MQDIKARKSICFLVVEHNSSGGNITIYKQAEMLARNEGYEVSIFFIRSGSSSELLCPPIKGVNLVQTSWEKTVFLNQRHNLVICTFWITCFELPSFRSEQFAYFVQSDERRFYIHQRSDLEAKNYFAVDQTYRYFPGPIICIAKWMKQWFKKEFGRDCYHTPIGIDQKVFNPDVKPLAKSSTKPRVLIEGPRDVEFKRVDFAQMCIAPFRDEVEIWHLSNDGKFRTYWHADKIFTAVPHKRMPALMKSCDFMLKLSVVEGFFAPPLEMMALGRTALTSNVTGADEYLVNNHNSLVVPMDDYAATTKAIARIIRDEPLRLRLSEGGLDTARSMDWEAQHQFFKLAIEDILEKRQKTNMECYNALRVFGAEYKADALATIDQKPIPSGFAEFNLIP